MPSVDLLTSFELVARLARVSRGILGKGNVDQRYAARSKPVNYGRNPGRA